MRIIVGLLIACSWIAAPSADAKPASAKHAAVAKKARANTHKKPAAKTEEVVAEKPAPAPPQETRVERAPVKQVVDDEEPAVRKRK